LWRVRTRVTCLVALRGVLLRRAGSCGYRLRVMSNVKRLLACRRSMALASVQRRRYGELSASLPPAALSPRRVATLVTARAASSLAWAVAASRQQCAGLRGSGPGFVLRRSRTAAHAGDVTSRASVSDSSSERPALALSQHATGAAMRSDAWAASAARSRIAFSSSVVGGSIPSWSAYAAIHCLACISPAYARRRSAGPEDYRRGGAVDTAVRRARCVISREQRDQGGESASALSAS
jgi:hypothetical protein